MKLNEHNSKQVFRDAGLPVPQGILVRPGQEPVADFPLPWMLKAQVLAGGRGKAGGILMAKTADQARIGLQSLFDLSIKGEAVRLVRIEPNIAVTREMYLSVSLHRQH